MTPDGVSLYDQLGVPESATPHEIALAFRRAAKQCHPDLNADRHHEATEQMKRIAAAYATLRDPERRVAYDRSLRAAARNGVRADTSKWDTGQTGPLRGMGGASCVVTVLDDPAPPPGYMAASRRVALNPRFWSNAHRRADRLCRTLALELGASALVGLAVCPFLAFLLAGWHSHRRDMVRWGAFYALTVPLWVVGVLATSSSLQFAGRALLLLGFGHCVCWRRRLHAAIADSSGPPQ